MFKIESLINILKKNNCNFFTGVPDSVLKELSYFLGKKSIKEHLIATSEGSAVSLGIGYYLSTKKLPCIYMQNSGLSNAINPLISIAHKKVYSIPMVLIIGWRGSPRIKDEPQHMLKGRITKELLKLLNINFTILKNTRDLKYFDKLIKTAKKNNSIIACLIEQGTIKKSSKKIIKKNYYNLEKEIFLKTLIENIPADSKVVCSTGYNSRELMFLREKYLLNNNNDFYMVGGMGHATSVALGYSLNSKNTTICIDGDGSLLMHLGSLKTAGSFANKNFKYILLNNNIHDSVGKQSTYANDVNFEKLALSLGFKKFYSVKNENNLKKIVKKFIDEKFSSFFEVKVANSKIKKLPRPNDLIKIKNEFMKND